MEASIPMNPENTPPNSKIVRVVTPDGPIGIISLLVDRLLEKGIIVKDDAGVYQGPCKADLNQWLAEYGLCDFCSVPDPEHTIMVPDFEVPGIKEGSVGGWAACAECYALVRENRRADLLRRSVDRVLGGKFTSASLKGMHERFWKAYDSMNDAAGIALAFNDFIEDRIPSLEPTAKNREKRMEAIRRLTGLTQDEMDALGKGDIAYKEVAKKLGVWHRKYGTKGAEGILKLTEHLSVAQPPMQPGVTPHWQRAIDMKFDALGVVTKWMERGVSHFPQSIDVLDPKALRDIVKASEKIQLDYSSDVRSLRLAEVYSFNADTMGAIMKGSQSIPHESPLSSVEIPRVAAGWFWFAQPFPDASSPLASDTTAALLWSWVRETPSNRDGIPEDLVASKVPVLRFSSYVLNDKGDPSIVAGHCLPSTRWYWPLNLTFHEMIAFNTESYRAAYGPGGIYEKEKGTTGEEATIKTVTELSLFFMMACVWFKQRILVESPGHVERHAKKRYQREHKLSEPPSVRVIALRRALRPATDTVGGEGNERHYFKDFQIVVDGHPRLQACGPGNKDHKLIWIDPYPKGNPNAPFRDKPAKVFAVVR